jgi:ATP-binding cassette subfamily F protein 3
MDARASEQTIRVYLGGFAFSGEKALQTVEHFSGGEKARLALAMIVWQQPNLLLLDEPTNHLDIDMRAALSLALQEYSGALVLVSHDRHLLRTTTDELLLVAHGKITPFDGDLRDYEKWLQEFRRDMAKNPKPQTAVKATADQKVVLKEVKQLEAQIEQINLQLEKLEMTLADPSLYEEPKKAELKTVLAEQATLKQQQTTVETKWLLLCEELENG